MRGFEEDERGRGEKQQQRPQRSSSPQEAKDSTSKRKTRSYIQQTYIHWGIGVIANLRFSHCHNTDCTAVSVGGSGGEFGTGSKSLALF
jgi:hypothetical protein